MPASTLAPATLWRYGATVLPHARCELRRWRRRAQTIPDRQLRAHACATLREEAGNAEGAALLALAAPLARRAQTVRLLVGVQVLYDYLDTLSEQPASDPLAASRRLHGALAAVLAERELRRAADWYRGYRHGDDGGYLDALVASCRARLGGLPARALVVPGVARAIARASESQSRNHAAMLGALEPAALAAWARGQVAAAGATAPLLWWELAAASGSSLAIHALLAAAADARLTRAAAAAIESAYWPWACALNTLLESVADADADARSGNSSWVARYPSPEDAAQRLATIAGNAGAAVRGLPDASHHATVLAAMACFYLEEPRPAGAAAPAPAPAAVRSGVSAQLGADSRLLHALLRLQRSM